MTKSAPAKKIKKNSNRKPLRSRTGLSWQERLFERGVLREKPITMQHLKEVGDRFIAFCEKMSSQEDLRSDKAVAMPFYLEDFLVMEGIPYRTMENWRKKSEYLEECIQFGFNNYIGVHQERGAAIRKFSEKTIHMGLHHYLDRWKKIEKYHKELRKEDDPVPTNVIVKMRDYSDAE